jgi:hypothetical protein
MKKYILSFALVSSLLSFTGCKKFLDVNSDPDTPQNPDASSVFPAMLAAIPRGTQFDGRFISKYIQNFGASASTRAEAVWDNHGFQGFPTATDVGGDIWRQAYYGLGANLDYIINQGKAKEQWDYVGAGYALKALMFQMTTDVYGEIIFTEAFKENTSVFKYDDQETVYRGVDSICRLAVANLSRNDLKASNSTLSKGDFVYSGNRALWIKLVYGIMAKNFHRYTNKTTEYNTRLADSVIKYVDLSFANTNEDFVIPFDATKNDDTNFFGPYRDNLTFFRQTNFIVKLLDGTTLANSQAFLNRDPRIRHMLSASNDTTNGNGGYRGVDPGAGDAGAGNSRVAVPWGDSTYANPSANRFDPTRGKYLFRDKAVSPVMTYSELQFTKAEAAFRKSNRTLAYTAYINGIKGHFDFINRSVFPKTNTPLFNVSTISVAEMNRYLASANVRQASADLTFTDIMLQKYIALWGWGFVETWVDLRRFHYTDPDPSTTLPVYKNFFTPTFPASNNGSFAYRIRPRYNSEYVWNREELDRIGATAPDYHTRRVWFSLP